MALFVEPALFVPDGVILPLGRVERLAIELVVPDEPRIRGTMHGSLVDGVRHREGGLGGEEQER